MSDMTTKSTLQSNDYKQQLAAEKARSVARRAEIRAAAKANGVTVQSKARRLAVEVFRSFSRLKVTRWLETVLPSADEEKAIAAQVAVVAEWQSLLDSATDATRPMILKALDGAVMLHRVMVEKSAGGGSLSADEQKEMNVLAIAAIKSGKATSVQIASFVAMFVDVLPTVGIEK